MAVKADATLVGAAFNLGRSNVPHDTSRIFKEQFKALEGMNIAKAAMFGNIGGAGIVVGEKIDQNKRFEEGRDKMVDEFTTSIAEVDRQNYENGGGPDEDTVAAQQQMLEEVKEQIEVLRDAPGVRTPEQNRQLKQLQKSVGAWRDENNKEMARLRVSSYNLATDNVDFNQSFLSESALTGEKVKDANKKMLFTQIASSGIRLSDAGITIGRNDKGERGYYYDPNIDRVNQQAQIEDGTYVPEPSDDSMGPKNMKFISADELFSNLVLKDKALETDAAGIIGESMGLATAADYAIEIDPITGNKTKSKNKKLLYKTYDAAAPGQEEKIYERIMATHEAGSEDGVLGKKRDVRAGIKYVSNNDMQVGDGKFNYNKDSQKNPSISALSYSKLGLQGGSVDENNDGVITGNELSNEDKAAVHNKLMNPETAVEVEISARELAKYLDMQARDQFNKTRKQAEMMGPRPKPTQRGSGTRQDPVVRFALQPEENKFANTSTRASQLQDMTGQLFEMQNNNASSYDTDNYVDLFGMKIGYFPGKGFAPININKDGQVATKFNREYPGVPTYGKKPLNKYQNPKTPIGGYMDSPEAVFKRYSIPVEYSNIRTSSNRNTSFNSNK